MRLLLQAIERMTQAALLLLLLLAWEADGGSSARRRPAASPSALRATALALAYEGGELTMLTLCR